MAGHVLPVSTTQFSPVLWANTGPIGREWARALREAYLHYDPPLYADAW